MHFFQVCLLVAVVLVDMFYAEVIPHFVSTLFLMEKECYLQ